MRQGEGPLSHLKEHRELIEADLSLLLERGASGLVVDVGAGRGSFVSSAASRGLAALAVDVQPEAAFVWPKSGVAGLLADGCRLPLRDACAGVIRMKEIIEHLQDPLALVREAKRVLRPGGLVLAHVPTPYSQLYPVGNFWDDYTHVRPFSRLGLQRLFADAGLDVLLIEGYTAGRNGFERALGKLLGAILPHIYRVLAVRPPRPAAIST